MGFSFLQLILLSDAQGGVLFHILGVSVEDRLQDVGDELLHLLGCTAHKVLRHKARHDLLFGQAKGRVGSDAVYHVVGQAFFLDLLAGGNGVLAQALVQVAFNLGNALGAYVGGLPIGHGLGYEYTALPGAAFVLLGMTAAMIYIRKYPRHEQR